MPPQPRRRRWAILLLALLLAALPAGAQDQADSTRLERWLQSRVPGLQVQGLRGPLSRRPGFTRLTLSDAQGIWLEILDAETEWVPTALLRRQLHLAELSAARVTLFRLPGSEAPPAPPAEAPPTQLLPEMPSLPVALRLDRLRIGRAELAPAVLGQPLALTALGSLRLDAAGLDFALDAALIDGGTVLNGRGVLRPETGRLVAAATLRGEPGSALSHLAGLGERPLAVDLRLDGPVAGAAFSLRAEAGPGIAAALDGTIAAPDTVQIGAVLEGELDASGLVAPGLSALAGPVAIRLDAGRRPDGVVELRALHLRGAAGEMEANGRLDPAGAESRIALRAALAPSEAFAALLPGDALGWDGVAAEAALTGPLDAPVVALTVTAAGFRAASAPVAALLGTAPRLALHATAPDRIESLALTGQALRAAARGRVGAELDLAFEADIAAPEGTMPGLAGALRVEGNATGPAGDPTLTLAAQSERLEAAGRVLEALTLTARIATPASRPEVQAQLDATVAELPVSLALRGTPEDGGWLRLAEAEAQLGPARLAAAGRLHPSRRLAEGEARLAADDLAPLSQLLGRPVAGALRIEAEGAVRDGVQALSAKLAVPRFAGFGLDARGVTATASGSLAALDLALAGEVNAVQAAARGRLLGMEDGGRRLDLAALSATMAGETLRLAAPTRLTLRPDGGVQLAPTTLALRGGTLRGEGSWGPERADLRATLAALDLAAFAPLLPDAAPAGTLSGEARITGPVAAPEITANLRGRNLRAGPDAARSLPPGELRLDLRRNGGGLLTAEAELRIGPQQRLLATARFPRGPAADAPFEATLGGAVDLGALLGPALAAGADRVGGRLTLALRAGGTPAQPLLGGEARLAGGTYRNAIRGVNLTEIAGTFRPDGARLRADLAGRTSGEGRITVAGTIEPFTRHLPVDLRLVATNAQPVASDLLRTTLDADLRLAGLLGTGATLSGPVRIRRAEFRIPERLGGSARSLQPVREIGAPPGRARRAAPPPAAAGAGPPITLAITVEAPRNVFVRGRGLDAELGGELAVAGMIAAPEITGGLDLRRGDIAVIGRRIAFDRGKLTWTGALLPDLDLRATSQVGGVTARAEVKGSPRSPEIVFSSTPELPQDEVLARLLFDRPLRELSPFEIAQIASALAGVAGLPGGDAAGGFLDRLRQGLALDRLAVTSDSERAGRNSTEEDRRGAALEAGRYVADGVYVGVRQGTEGGSRVGVRVDLTPRMRLDAETGDREAGSRLGVSWEWEWGR